MVVVVGGGVVSVVGVGAGFVVVDVAVVFDKDLGRIAVVALTPTHAHRVEELNI